MERRSCFTNTFSRNKSTRVIGSGAFFGVHVEDTVIVFVAGACGFSFRCTGPWDGSLRYRGVGSRISA